MRCDKSRYEAQATPISPGSPSSITLVGDLARCARISPQTASSHLDKLFKANLLRVEIQGRHHYYGLRNARVAELIESFSVIARPVEPLTEAQREGRAAQICPHMLWTSGGKAWRSDYTGALRAELLGR